MMIIILVLIIFSNNDNTKTNTNNNMQPSNPKSKINEAKHPPPQTIRSSQPGYLPQGFGGVTKNELATGKDISVPLSVPRAEVRGKKTAGNSRALREGNLEHEIE